MVDQRLGACSSSDADEVIRALPVAAYVCDAPEGAIRVWNRGAAEVWGREPADPSERFCGSFRLFRTDGTALSHDDVPVAHVLATGEPQTGEVIICRPDLLRVAVRIQASPIRDETGRLTGAIAVLHEITDQERAKEALWQSELRYRTIVEDQPDMVCRFRPDGTLTFANEAYCTYFGIAREDAEGKKYAPVVYPDDLPAVREQVAKLSPDHPVVFIENRVVRADGVVRWTEWTNRALFDDRGRLVEFQSGGRDVTERKQAEQDAARLAAIVANADSAILGMTLAGTITSWNRSAERMFGYPAAEAVGQPIGILIPDDRRSEGEEILARLGQGETVRHLETERVARDGRRIPVSLTVSPILDGQGRLIGISKIARDITDRKQLDAARDLAVRRESEARAAAEEASRLKDEFLAVVSHELRTPLNAILGWAQMLRDGRVDPHNASKALHTIERNARMQARLIEDLLDVARIVGGKLPLHIEHIDLGAVVQAAAEAVRPAIANKEIELHVDLGETAITLSGDPARLQQVVWNLLTNAVKFTPRQGRIDVVLRRTASDAKLTVRDTGTGIPSDALPFIFDRFRQADARATRAHGGLGLGLTIVEYLAEAHGGTVEAESAGPGHGATFTITIPMKAESARLDSPPCGSGTRPDLWGLRVLYVDDDSDAREMVAAMLGRAGATVIALASVDAAMEAISSQPFDVLLGDIGMPDRDGLDLIRAARAVPGVGSMPAIALTAYAGERHRDAALAAGYDRHLAKPIDADVLCATILELKERLPSLRRQTSSDQDDPARIKI